jgi:hypothetical protein
MECMFRKVLYSAFSLLGERQVKRFMKASVEPRNAQQACLMSIISSNKSSQFGRQHDFSSIKDIRDFCSAVPVRDYEQMRAYVERAANGESAVLTASDPVMFATTSGTTAQPKYIPITKGYIEEFRRASVVSGYFLLKNNPQLVNGTTLSVVSPAEEGRTAGGIPYGAISGQLFRNEPFLIRKYISPIPYDVFLLKDYESKYYTLLRLALALPVSVFYTLNPSTIALLCRRLKQYAPTLVRDVRDGTVTAPAALPASTLSAVKHLLSPDPARAAMLEQLINAGAFVPYRIWPTLQVVSCWTKAAASFYLADFPEFFGSVPISDITYGASEGRGTVFIGPDKQMLALLCHFFEFIPEEEIESANPTVLLADELQQGRNYFILFTTSGGLYRYNINDVVKVVGFHNATPLLEFQYKGGNICSFTGEKITELQVTEAMSQALAQTGLQTRFFTVLPQFRPNPHYELWIEPQNTSLTPQAVATLSESFDQFLGKLNVEYKTKRESLRLDNVSSRLISPGSYEGFRKHLVAAGVADAQIKVSHLNPKQETRDYFEATLVKEGSVSWATV